jgi:two-component system, LuxR family, sensor kinase FixL
MRNDDHHAPSAASRPVALLAVAAAYWAGSQVGLLLTPDTLAVSVMWPPNAILFGALLLAPRSRWPWYLLAVLPVHLVTQLLHGIPLLTSAGWFVTNTGEALLGAVLLRRLRSSPLELFDTFVGVLVFLAAGVLGTVGVSSLLDAAVVVLTGAGQGYWEVSQHRFASNALATLTLVPPIVMLGSFSLATLRALPRSRYVEGALLGLGTLYAVNLLFAGEGQIQASIEGLTYTVLPLMFWAAVRFGPAGVSILQLFSTFAVLRPVVGSAIASPGEVLSLQMSLAMLNGLSLALAVVVRESRRLQLLHSAVLRSMRNAVAITDSAGVVIDANDSWIAVGRPRELDRLDGVAVHENYLEHQFRLARRSPHAGRLAAGLEDVLAGTKSVFEMEYPCRTADNLKWFAVSVVPLSGEQRGAVVTHSDISSRKHEEAAALQVREELSHAGRVMTMGMLSASLTHELSQPLAAILGNAQAARRLCARNGREDIAEVEVILADVVAASRRAGSILRRLRSWFSNGRHDAQPLCLNDVADDVIEILRGDLTRRGVSVTRRLAAGLPTIKGDRVQLQQVVLNLILNACDAMRENAPGDRQVVVTTTQSADGVQLAVEDVGPGIAPDRLSSVFEPFVTTKPTGLGLGLALCRSIIRAHEGQLTAENNAVRGVTFRCILPMADSRAPAAIGQ